MSGLSRWAVVPALAASIGLVGISAATAAPGDTTYLVAELTGANEVRTAATPAGDPDGYGVEVVAITGNEVRYGIAWTGIVAPSGAHIHTGITGVNGPVKVDYGFGAALPATVTAVVGRVTTADTALLESIKADPGAFYANVHNAAYPAGAIRGQFRKIDGPVDFDEILGSGFLRAHLNGMEEVNAAGDEGAGDLNGRGWSGVDASGRRVAFAVKWAGIKAPSAAHIHEGARGVSGPVVVPLFAATDTLPKSVQGVAGYVRNQDSALLARIRRSPAGFYVNLHNAEFPAGAVRGQLRYLSPRELGLTG